MFVLNAAHSKNAWTLRRSTPASRKKHRGKPRSWRKFGPCLWLRNQRLVSEVVSLWCRKWLYLRRVSSWLSNTGKSARNVFLCCLAHIIQKDLIKSGVRASERCVVELFLSLAEGLCARLWDVQNFKKKRWWFLKLNKSCLLAAQSPALLQPKCSSALCCLSFLLLALVVTSSVTLDQCISWTIFRVPVSRKLHFCLFNQRFSLKSARDVICLHLFLCS